MLRWKIIRVLAGSMRERERERVPILSFGFCFAFLKKKKINYRPHLRQKKKNHTVHPCLFKLLKDDVESKWPHSDIAKKENVYSKCTDRLRSVVRLTRVLFGIMYYHPSALKALNLCSTYHYKVRLYLVHRSKYIFQFSNNITRIFIYFFVYKYFLKNKNYYLNTHILNKFMCVVFQYTRFIVMLTCIYF